MKGMNRPEAIVLPSSALVPAPNLVVPPPNQFTHTLTQDQDFYFGDSTAGGPPDCQLTAGTSVVLLRRDGPSRCRIIDSAGRHVETAWEGLKAISP